jgi:hypothetical protein
MYIKAMTHRDELFRLTMRWMNDDFYSEDGKTVSRIFLLENAIASVVTGRLIDFLDRVFSGPLQMERVRQKQVLRERIIHYLPNKTSRNNFLAENFRQNPEFFFPGLPLDAIILTTPASRLVATGRIKQQSRIAEKVSFRMVDALFQEIQAEARSIAAQRAATAGIPLADLRSSPETMQEDFIQAEARVAGHFKDNNVQIEPSKMCLNDLIGFKIICRQEFMDRIPELLNREPGIRIMETERHSGIYKAVNLLVEIDLPAPEKLAAHLEGFDWSIAVHRGLNPDELRKQIPDYVIQGAGRVQMEIILTTYDELMESEFGRSIHELRILRLRQRQTYSGLVAQNVSYLVEYLLALAFSPTVEIPELPVKIYGRYLPETITASKWALYGYEKDDQVLNAFCPQRYCSG